jgi:hypothetical protein
VLDARSADAGHVWRIAEIRIESHVVVGRVEYWVIEDVEKLSVEAKSESLGDLCVFEGAEIETRLKGRPENVATCGAIAGFERVAHRHAHLTRRDERDAKCSGVHHDRPNWSGYRSRRNARGNFLGAGRGLTWQQWNNGIADEIVRAVVHAGYTVTTRP